MPASCSTIRAEVVSVGSMDMLMSVTTSVEVSILPESIALLTELRSTEPESVLTVSPVILKKRD